MGERRESASRTDGGAPPEAWPRAVRGDHIQAQERGERRAEARAAGQGPRVLQPYRQPAADLRPRRLHPALSVVRRESAQLHPPECGRWYR